MYDVSIIKCTDYSSENVRPALNNLLEISNSLDFIKPGLKVVIKANLVTFMKPESARNNTPCFALRTCKNS